MIPLRGGVGTVVRGGINPSFYGRQILVVAAAL